MRPRGSPRGIAEHTVSGAPHRVGFNEAAGKSPRNPLLLPGVRSMRQVPVDPRCRACSMRRGSPRGIGRRRFNEAAGKSPRNLPSRWPRCSGAVSASMRPRGSPRGILSGPSSHTFLTVASMRPRGSPRGIHTQLTACRFNEAAGKSPRNRARSRSWAEDALSVASMRPRGSPRGIPAMPVGMIRRRLATRASMRPRGSPRGIRAGPPDSSR